MGSAFQNGTATRGITALTLLCGAVLSAWPQAKPANGTTTADVSKAPVTPSAEDRQKAMQADMDRLLKLARQLKAEVDISRRDELSVKVVRDADEIDKLARSARGRIR